MSILAVGSVALDSIETPFGKTEGVLGGSAVYFSISASFFAPVNLVAVVGDDFPEKHTALLQKHRIDIKGLEIAKGQTFKWKGKYGYDLNNPKTIYTHLNVFKHFSPRIPAEYRRSDVVFLANIDPELQMNVMKQVERPRITACDTMNYWIENKRKAVLKISKQVDIFLLNEAEARELSGESNLLKAGRAILALGPKKVIIKKGEHGVLFFSDNSVFSTPAYLLETISDPTGAGDSFAGGVMGYLRKSGRASDSEIRKGIIYGTIMASYAVEDFSLNRLSKIVYSDVQRRYHSYRQLTRY
ncbi:MAG: PfkB family carbohydrate kinase [Candidatus Omnitrophota bacterium]|nr:PfkB family carbohydrate kinase [Candidatus Omnitrophota bacterium]